MKKSLFVIAIVLSLVCASAFAGKRLNVPVWILIDETNYIYYADGSMIDASEAPNDGESIGCGIKIYAGSHPWASHVFCQAEDASGQYVACRSQDLDLAKALSAINAYSYISFNWDPNGDPWATTAEPSDGPLLPATDGECTHIGVSSQSLYIPQDKKTEKNK